MAQQTIHYNADLRAPASTATGAAPKARVHAVEWARLMDGLPLEINPSTGQGFRCMSVDEWSARWKRSPEYPTCLACTSDNTKEHHFVQTWCRGKKMWESESLCLDCLHFSWRAYKDPDYLTPEEHEKAHWTALVQQQRQQRVQ